VGVSVEGCPGTSVSALLESVSDATTGTVTVTDTVPDIATFVALVARMIAVPPDTPVMVADVPLPDTVATAGDSDVHVTAPFAPLGATVADTDPVVPLTSARVAGVTEMEVTAGGCIGPSPPPPQAPNVMSPSRAIAVLHGRAANNDECVMAAGGVGGEPLLRLLTRHIMTWGLISLGYSS